MSNTGPQQLPLTYPPTAAKVNSFVFFLLLGEAWKCDGADYQPALLPECQQYEFIKVI